ncbi:MAG: 1-acyl-sn-glycerol-3-phosphate acyltransferase [Gemmatimonadaceae bacterium]|nr:1-acyl-sn-glycerol-3-phosphate acyltransferase [Gemmatimonadaceae bacterium]
MIYRFFRWIAGIMLHWFYSEIRIDGGERIPKTGPLLVAVNHPNAMVDSLVAGWVVPRPLRITAKATLFQHPFVSLMFKLLGVVPLRRVSDTTGNLREDYERNSAAFQEIIGVLREGGAVLIFPEGRSNSDELLPLKTGLARIALAARQSGVRGVGILTVGLTFENKSNPGTRVVAIIEDPLDVDSWQGESTRALTDSITERLLRASSGTLFPTGAPTERAQKQMILVRAASWWGRTTHEIPIRYARSLALSRSQSADEPAMLTMLFGIGLILASYAIHVALVGLLTRSALVTGLYLATLITGAYWTAFEGHSRAVR